MRYLLIALCLMAFTPIYTNHDSPGKVDQEFKNIENSLQDQQFTIVKDTPALSSFRNGQIVIVSSGAFNKLMLRSGQEIYSVNLSCITITR